MHDGNFLKRRGALSKDSGAVLEDQLLAFFSVFQLLVYFRDNLPEVLGFFFIFRFSLVKAIVPEWYRAITVV